MNKKSIEKIISLIKKNRPDLFSYDVVDLIDFYNSERGLPKNDEERYDATYEIAKSLGINDENSIDNNHIDFNEEKRKTFYRNSHIKYGVLSGRNIVFTGKGPFVRGELMSIARKAGAEISSAVSSRTNLLVVGSKPGSKLRKAKRLNMDIISIEEFFNIVEGKEVVSNVNDKVDTLVEVYGKVLNKYYRNKNIAVLIKDENLKNEMYQIFKRSCDVDIEDFDDKKTDVLIYQIYYEDSDIIRLAEDNDIQVMSLGELNRQLLFLNKTIL